LDLISNLLNIKYQSSMINFFKIFKAVETDLSERELYNNENDILLIEDPKKIYLNFNKFEIKTIKLSISIKK